MSIKLRRKNSLMKGGKEEILQQTEANLHTCLKELISGLMFLFL